MNVSSGQTVSKIHLSGGMLDILSGGTAVKTTMDAGELIVAGGGVARGIVAGGFGPEITVSSGGVASGIHLLGRDGLLYDSGTTTGTVVNGSNELVYLFGVDTGATIIQGEIQVYGNPSLPQAGMLVSATVDTDGGVQLFGGTIAQAQIDGGSVSLLEGATSIGNLVENGGTLQTDGGGPNVIMDATIRQGSTLVARGVGDLVASSTVAGASFIIVSSGGTARDDVVSAGGILLLLAGAIVSDTQVASGGLAVVEDGASGSGLVAAAGANVVSTGVVTIAAGGSGFSTAASSTGTVTSGAQQFILAGGVASGETFAAGASGVVASGGVLSNVVVASGSGYPGDEASVTVRNGGNAVAVTVQTGGLLNIDAGADLDGAKVAGRINDSGKAENVTITPGGTGEIDGGDLDDLTVDTGADFFVVGGTISGGLVTSGSAVIVDNLPQDPTFTPRVDGLTVASGGRLELFNSREENALTLQQGGTLTVTQLAYVSGGTTSLDSNDILTIDMGGREVHLRLAGSYAGTHFVLGQTTLAPKGTDITVVAGAAAMGASAMGPAFMTGLAAEIQSAGIAAADFLPASHAVPSSTVVDRAPPAALTAVHLAFDHVTDLPSHHQP